MFAPAPCEELGDETVTAARTVVGRERNAASELGETLGVDQRRRIPRAVVEMRPGPSCV